MQCPFCILHEHHATCACKLITIAGDTGRLRKVHFNPSTALAGIIGAKNQGSGLFGVVPGMPIVAMKVLGSNGQGSLDAVWNAYTEVISRLQQGQKITSVNLSLGAQVSDSSTVQTECGYVSKIASFGTAVAVAAGKQGLTGGPHLSLVGVSATATQVATCLFFQTLYRVCNCVQRTPFIMNCLSVDRLSTVAQLV